MKVLLLLSHPRQNSLCGQVFDHLAETLAQQGHIIDIADLHREGFDPVMRSEDEPDWYRPDKTFRGDVAAEIARIERNDALVAVFPVYWWSMPAMLKGWIDRVWTYGWAYGGRSLPLQRVWLVGIAGNSMADHHRRRTDHAMMRQLERGLLDYCGVEDHRLELLYGSLAASNGASRVLSGARELAAKF